MEPESSLPYSQVPTTCPYPEPTPSSPHNHSHFLKIRLNIIVASMSGSRQWSLSLRFPHQNPVHTYSLAHTRHIPPPPYYSLFYHQHNTHIQNMKYLLPLCSNRGYPNAPQRYVCAYIGRHFDTAHC